MYHSITRYTNKVVASIVNFLCRLSSALVRILPHTSGLGVVMSAVGIEIPQVLCRVLSDSQIPDSVSLTSIHFRTNHVHVIHIFVLIFFFRATFSIIFIWNSFVTCHQLSFLSLLPPVSYVPP